MPTNLRQRPPASLVHAPLRSTAPEPIDLSPHWRRLKRRWKPAAAVFAVTMATAAALAAQQKPSYTASAKLLLRSDRRFTPSNNALGTAAETIRSRPILERTIQTLQLRDAQGQPMQAEDLAPAINVKAVAGADVLQVTYRDRVADRAAPVINQLLQQYIKQNVATTRAEAHAAGAFIDQALPKSEATIQQLNAALRQFKERSQLADFSGEQQLLTAGVSTLENQITQANSELTEANARYSALRGRLQLSPTEAIAISSLSQSPNIQQAISQWQAGQTELQLESTRLRAKHPRIQMLQRQEQALNQLLRQRLVDTVGSETVGSATVGSATVGSDQKAIASTAFGGLKQTLVQDYLVADIARNSLVQRIKTLTKAHKAYRQRLGQFPQLEQQQRDLQRRLDVAQVSYASLTQRRQDVQLAERQTVGTASWLEPAIAPKHANIDGKLMCLGGGALLGSLLASATILGLELADRSIKSVKAAKDLFGYSCLGTIPYWGNPRQARRQLGLIPQIPVREMPRSFVSAAYRMVQANLRFVQVDASLRSLVITSSVPQEGKSTVAANLAATMAQLGRKVLLIDADLHHPTQHHIWGLDHTAGLSDLIVGRIGLRQAIRPVMPNLHLLSAGMMPPNPLTILDSHRMAKLIKGLETVYDMVIIDSPPLIVEAEALTLGRLAQGMMLVVRPGLLPTATAQAAKALLHQSGQTVVGMVINSSVLEPEAYRHTDYNRDYYSPEAAVPALV